MRNVRSDAPKAAEGFALVATMMLLALVMSLLAGYWSMTRVDLSTTRSSIASTQGFYAAEAGSNLRAHLVREVFEGYNRPMGASPDEAAVDRPCTGTNLGSGDFACIEYDFGPRAVETYLVEAASNPTSIVIPRGEPFQNLNAQEYGYSVNAASRDGDDRPEALLEVQFKSRLVPMFQFAVFYNKDLEILPGPNMTIGGPVHTNGDLYLGTHNLLQILGQVTTAGDLYMGRKDTDDCMGGTVSVIDPVALRALPPCVAPRTLLAEDDLEDWNGMILTGIEPLEVPPPEALDPVPGQIYFDRADLRVELDLNGATPEIHVLNPDGTLDGAAGDALEGCAGAVEHSDNFYNNREATMIEMLDVNVHELLDCIHVNSLMGPGKGLDDTSEGGLVWHFSVNGPDSDDVNNYGVRVRNGADIDSSEALAPEVRGLTIVTDQAIYVQGNYNSTDKLPAAFLADSLNVLSNAWVDGGNKPWDQRNATSTTVLAAFLAGTDVTGGAEGAGGQDDAEYNGGLENYPRFHENWTGDTLTYSGSFVSLNAPRHVDGAWLYGPPQYTAPNRNWSYDEDFDSAENLPPLSPRFVYLRQELFVREFEE